MIVNESSSESWIGKEFVKKDKKNYSKWGGKQVEIRDEKKSEKRDVNLDLEVHENELFCSILLSHLEREERKEVSLDLMFLVLRLFFH